MARRLRQRLLLTSLTSRSSWDYSNQLLLADALRGEQTTGASEIIDTRWPIASGARGSTPGRSSEARRRPKLAPSLGHAAADSFGNKAFLSRIPHQAAARLRSASGCETQSTLFYPIFRLLNSIMVMKSSSGIIPPRQSPGEYRRQQC